MRLLVLYPKLALVLRSPSKGRLGDAGAAEWADMEAAGQMGSPLREADAALVQLAPLRPYAAGARHPRVSVVSHASS